MLTAFLSRRAGGLFDAVRGLSARLQDSEAARVSAIGLADDMTATDAEAWEGINVKAFPVRGPTALGYAPRLTGALQSEAADVLHLHGLWMYPSAAAQAWSRHTGRPVVISPHGMLDSWAVRNSRWKKRLVGALYEHRNLRNAACLHALCEAEAEGIRSYGLGNPICVIPNGVDLPAYSDDAGPPWTGAIPTDANVLLYLGRLHPKKNLQALVDAWHGAASFPGAEYWWLVIAGWDQAGYKQHLRRRVDELAVPRVWFAGPQFKEAKTATFRHAAAFVLPSLSEGLPMTVLEAWSYGLPVLMTPECNLPRGFEAGAALRIGSDTGSLVEGLRALFAENAAGREEIGRRGRALVESDYSWPRVAEQMIKVYRWVLGEGPRPVSVE